MQNSDIDTDEIDNDDSSSNDTDSGDTANDGVFDDIEDDATGFEKIALAMAEAEVKNNRNKRKRTVRSPSDTFNDLLRAIKRRRRRKEELERQFDPEQFDDAEYPLSNSGGLTSCNSQQFFSRKSRTTTNRKNRGTRMAKDEAVAISDNPVATGRSSSAAFDSDINVETPFDAHTRYKNNIQAKNVREASNKMEINGDTTDVDNKDQNVDIDRETSPNNSVQNDNAYFKFDERKFFSTPTFKPEVKEEAFRKIYASIELPLRVFEEHGYEAYRQYIDGSNVEDDDNNGDTNIGSKNVTKADHKFRVSNKKIFRGLFSKFKKRNTFRELEKQKEESIRDSLKNALVNGDPREYQRTIFEVAKKRNTIVNLGTGSGKTLIALLLIREIWSAQKASSPDEKGSELEEAVTIPTSGEGNADASNKNTKSSEGNSNKMEKKTEKKQTLFLVPSVALAIQQSLTLRANLPNLWVETACYTIASSKRARTALGNCDVIVATHGVIQDLLMHYGDTFRMDRFNLIVIDECHYAASGNHSYRHLMTKFYHPIEAGKRPRVMGLTASPLLNVKENHSDEQLSAMLDNLERVLDSKMLSAEGLIGAKSNTSGTTVGSDNLLNRVIDEWALEYRETNMCRTIPSADNLKLLPSRFREFKQLEQLYKDLGPLVLTIYCAVLRKELSKNIFENESTQQFECAVNHLQRIEEFCNREVRISPTMGRNDKMLALEELIETLVEERGGTKTIGLVFVERRITAIALHCYFRWRNQKIRDGSSADGWKFAKQARRETRKAATFYQLTTTRSNSDGSGDEKDQFDDSVDDPFYVFQRRNESQRRNEVKCMIFEDDSHENGIDRFHSETQFMDADSESEDEMDDSAQDYAKKDFEDRLGRVVVKSVALVRNPVQIFNSLSISQKNFKESDKSEQCKNWVHRESNVRDVLNKLRRGDTNLMFATSVVEEGVDVQACSFVVAFDGLTNIKGYIQMKGRARKKDAMFFVFRDPHDTRRSKLELSVAQKMERRVQRFIEERMRLYAPTIYAISSRNEITEGAAALPKEIRAIEVGAYKVGDATVDIQSAKSLLNRYFLSIPLDPFVRCKRESLLAYMPCFEDNRLVLPMHLPSDIRIVELPSEYNNYARREKQKVLSLMACVRLHCYGLLNERLLPLTRKDMQSRILQVAIQKLERIENVSLDLRPFYVNDRKDFVLYKFNQESHLLSKYRDKLNGAGRNLGLITTTRIRTIKPFQFFHSEFGKVDFSLGEAKSISCSCSEFDTLQEIFLLLFNARWSRKSRNIYYETRTQEQYDSVIPPYIIGILSSDGELDWDFMSELLHESKRSIEERTKAARAYSSTKQLRQPRIWCTSYNKYLPYIVFGPSGESCGARVPDEMKDAGTYCEYYKKAYSIDLPSDSPLFRVHRMWSLPSGLPAKPRVRGNEKNLIDDCFDFVSIPQEVSIEEPLANAYISLLCLFLPQLLFKFEQQQRTEAFIAHCEVHIPTLGDCFRKMDFSTVALAITAKSCNPEANYDSWEWVGDAVLKLLQTDSILKSNRFKHFVRFLHEGDLSMLRSSMGTNERLKQICKHLRLENYVMTTSLARGKWIPSPLDKIRSPGAKDETVQRMKILADVIESILGVVYLEFGYHVSMKVGNELHVTLPWDETDTSVACGESGDIENNNLLDVVQKCTGHSKTFDRPKIVSEAFTHPSAIDASVPSYQRLEWIGDAVLCLCTREWLYRNLGENTTLGDLVVSEGAIVSNETLGFISMKYGLQEYLDHRDQSLPKRIESYCWNMQEGCGLWGGDPPKPIADMVEAILGAIHVSCGFESGQDATKHLMSSIFSSFKEASSGGISSLNTFLKTLKHPKKALQEMTGQLLDVMVYSEHDFFSSYATEEDNEMDEKSEVTSNTRSAIPQILQKNEWRDASRGSGSESSYVAFVSILGKPLLVVADESVTVAKNRATSLVREAIERNPEIEHRIAKCRSEVESGLSLASRTIH